MYIYSLHVVAWDDTITFSAIFSDNVLWDKERLNSLAQLIASDHKQVIIEVIGTYSFGSILPVLSYIMDVNHGE